MQKKKTTYYQRNKETILARVNQKYKNDPSFREKVKEYSRNRYHEDEEYRKRTIDAARKRHKRQRKIKYIQDETGKLIEVIIERPIRVYPLELHIEGKPPYIQNLIQYIRKYILGLDSLMKEVPRKYYIAYKTSENIICMEPHLEKIKLYLKLKPTEIKGSPPFFRDVSRLKHFGTGDVELTISSKSEFDAIKPYIELTCKKIELNGKVKSKSY